MIDDITVHWAKRARMICSSEQPFVRGAFEIAESPEPEPIEHQMHTKRRSRADRETLRDIVPVGLRG